MDESTAKLAAGGIVLAVAFAVYATAENYLLDNTSETVTFKVNDKTVKYDSDGDSRYLVFATRADGKDEVFENTDSPIGGKMNSSDLQNFLRKDGTFTCTAYGQRSNNLSMYRNVLKCDGGP